MKYIVLFPPPTFIVCLSGPHLDNTAGIRTQRSGFNRHEQNVYFLPILVVDSGPPSLSSTGTLTIHVCGCDTGESYCKSSTIICIIITVTFWVSCEENEKVICAGSFLSTTTSNQCRLATQCGIIHSSLIEAVQILLKSVISTEFLYCLRWVWVQS